MLGGTLEGEAGWGWDGGGFRCLVGNCQSSKSIAHQLFIVICPEVPHVDRPTLIPHNQFTLKETKCSLHYCATDLRCTTLSALTYRTLNKGE